MAAVAAASFSQLPFSPLTLFESTLLNAGMLLDSMSMDELLGAMRLTADLHVQLIAAMRPCAAELQSRLQTQTAAAENFAREATPQPPVKRRHISSTSNHASFGVKLEMELTPSMVDERGDNGLPKPFSGQQRQHQDGANGNDCVDEGRPQSGGEKRLFSGVESVDSPPLLSAAMSTAVSRVAADNQPSLEQPVVIDLEDDDELLEAEATDRVEQQALQSPACSLVAGQGRDLLSNLTAGGGSGCVEQSHRDGISVGGTSYLRSAIKEAYKVLRGSGPHLFDFSKSWNDLANRTVAQNVIAQAQQSADFQSDKDLWLSACNHEFRSMQSFCLRNRPMWRKGKRQKAKLGRRQKAFEALLSNLSAEELEQYRVVLTRDLTSSDEEDEDEVLRVRDLAWQSDRVRQMKRRLDEAFLTRFATVKQRTQLDKCLRHPAVLSTRFAPGGLPNWALRTPPAPRLG